MDGFVTGPDDGPERGLGVGGERLHYWVFGGPWTDESPGRGEAVGEDEFVFVDGLAQAVERAGEAAEEKPVAVAGRADIIRPTLASGVVDAFTLIVAPVVLGAGKRLFDGFDQSVEFEPLGVRQSPFATFIDYRVKTGPSRSGS